MTLHICKMGFKCPYSKEFEGETYCRDPESIGTLMPTPVKDDYQCPLLPRNSLLNDALEDYE